MPIVEMPNGDQVNFPDDMPKEQIKGLIASKFPEFAAEQAQSKPDARYDKTRTFLGEALEGLPIIGNMAREASDMLSAGIISATGPETYDEMREKLSADREQLAKDNPTTATLGNITGAIAGTAPMISAAPAAFGVGSGPLIPRMLASGASGGALGATDAAVKSGGDVEATLKGGVYGGIGGAAGPAIGAGLSKGGRYIKDGVKSLVNPQATAKAKIAQAMQMDDAVISSSDEAIARQNGQTLMNVDRGGEKTRALARAASNVDPDARATMQRVTNDRFVGQSDRAVDAVKRVAGGEVDDIALQKQISSRARMTNSANYKKAYEFNFGNNHPVELDSIVQRVPATAIRNAMKVAKADGRPFGQQLIASIDDATGTVTFARKPSFQELDYIQRGLRGAIDKEFKSGAGEVGTAYKSLHKELLNIMDNVNPHYKQARAGAAAAFGVDDAVDAGKVFAKATRNTPEMSEAIKKMSPEELKAFKTGFASEIIDKIKSTNDRSNVIRSVFQSPEMRAKMTMAFGKAKADELEAFVRIEGVMDQLRGAMGNSTTARQLIELGLVGGGNATAGLYGLTTGDYRASAIAGGLTAARYGKGKADERTMMAIAKLLTSTDKNAITRVAANASMSGKYMNALRTFTDNLMSAQNVTIPFGMQVAD